MQELFQTNFTSLDYIIVACYLSGSLVVGVIANRYIFNVADYLVGGRASGTALNLATLIGTELGLVTLMYASVDAFSNGFAYVTLALIGSVVAIFLGGTGFVIARLRRMDLMTIPEYFERRFDRRTRVVAGVMCVLAGVLNMGMFPKMGAIFLTYVAGYGGTEDEHLLLVRLITSLLIVLVLLYTVLGGMVSVIVTDYVQFVVMSIGMFVGVYFCLVRPDLGWQNITTSMANHRGERMFNPLAAGGYGWTWLAFNAVVFLAAGIAWAPQATRALITEDDEATKKSFLFSAPGHFVRLGVPALWAVAGFTLIAGNPTWSQHFFPEGLAGPAKHATQAMPLTLGKIVPTGLLGLLVAGLLAAFMSTHDSYLLCWSSVITRDVVGPLARQELSDTAQIRITRISVVLIGVFLLIWGIWYETPESVWTYMGVTGTIYLSGAAVALVGGLYWSRASSAGALAALFGGSFALVGLFPKALGIELSGPAISLLTFALSAILLIGVSLLMPDRGKMS